MRYKKFGNTGTELSVICLGTWAIGGKEFGDVLEQDAIKSIHAMLDQGVNLIDTAPIYADGESERILGKALKGKRDQVFLVSKFGSYWPEGERDYKKGTIKDSSREFILKSIDETLMRLDTDYLDGYLIHWPDKNTPLEETVDALKELKKQGKIRFTGMSNFESPLVDQLYNLQGLDIAQYPYSMVDRSREEYLKTYSAKGVATMGYGTLGAGVLAGAIRELPNFPKDDARTFFYKFLQAPQFYQVMKLLETLDGIAAERGVPVAQVSLNWALQKEFMNACLTGVRSPEEAVENCAATKWELTGEELELIDQAIAKTLDAEKEGNII